MRDHLDPAEEARKLRQKRPRQVTLEPGPHCMASRLRLLRRQDGGYMVAALDYDDQAVQLPDGSLLVEVLTAQQVQQTEPRDVLAETLEQVHRDLNEVRLQAAVDLVADLGHQRDEEALVAMLRRALAER